MSEEREGRRGILLAFVGPSGAGKSSLCRELMGDYTELGFSVSYTTRAPRGQEQDGVEYHFVTATTFMAMVERGEFVEYAKVHGNLYGTRLSTVEAALSEGRDLLFDIDYQGALLLKKSLPETIGVMVLPPSVQVLETRLRGRETDTEAVILRRLEMARTEMSQLDKFDYFVINDEFKKAYSDVNAIYRASRSRVGYEDESLRGHLGIE